MDLQGFRASIIDGIYSNMYGRLADNYDYNRFSFDGVDRSNQVAVMDHLGIDRFAVLGMCIGGAFIMELLTEVPERITAAVALQPVGLELKRIGRRRHVRQRVRELIALGERGDSYRRRLREHARLEVEHA